MAGSLACRRGVKLALEASQSTAMSAHTCGSRSSSSATQSDSRRFGSEPSPGTSCTSSQSITGLDSCGYDVQEILGKGSLAIVYRVVRRSDGQEFAAKHLKTTDEEHREFMVGEYDIMRELNHENLLQAKALFKFQADVWLCLDLCKNGSVQSYVEAHGVFTERCCRALARQLVAGVDYLHCRRIVHGDLKPENLFLGDDALRLRIGDFNSARRVGSRTAGQRAGWMLSMRGTRLYCAPEVRFDLSWNERVDIWAMGLSVYFMARAKPPFDVGSSRNSEELRRGRLPYIAWEGMSRSMAHLVQQCLIVDMRDRPTAMELQFHPAFQAVSENRGDEAAKIPNFCQSGSVSIVANSCGLLFSCACSQTSSSTFTGEWRNAALFALASENFPTLERLPSHGAMGSWIV